MTEQPDIFARLAAPFPPERVSWRVGSTTKRAFEAKRTDQRRGQALCYIDARDVLDRLNEVMGPHWQNRFVPMPNGTTCCEIGLLIEGDWLWRSNGAGATGDTSDPNEREMAEKGGYSDAFKRAAVQWGVGQYLYAIDAGWIELDEKWRIPKDAYQQLNALLAGEKPKSAYRARKDGDDKQFKAIEAALRACINPTRLQECWKANWQTIKTWPGNWQQSITAEKDRCKAALSKKVAA